jgi:hypothetical protein
MQKLNSEIINMVAGGCYCHCYPNGYRGEAADTGHVLSEEACSKTCLAQYGVANSRCFLVPQAPIKGYRNVRPLVIDSPQ